jgi:methylglutaconyl-CoA hydratase
MFAFSEVKLGLIPAVIAPYVLAKIGLSAARELFVTGRRFDAEHARRIGLVHAVVPADQLDPTIDQYLTEVRANGREAMADAKTLLRAIAGKPVETVAEKTAEAIAQRRVSAEAQERMKRFLAK